jgi:hypothetical protein
VGFFRAATLMSAEQPLATPADWPIYKYQPITKQSLANLARRQLWAAPPSAFNDPFECRLQRADSPAGLSTLRRENPHMAHLTDDAFARKAIEAFEGQFANMGIVCFAQRLDNIQMWSHYADHHRGICLGFGREQPAKDTAVYRVIYTDDYPPLTFERTWHTNGLARVLYAKHSGWAYERELRMIRVIDPPDANRLADYPAPLCHVVFGLRTPESDKELVRSILRDESGVAYSQVQLEDTRFGLRTIDV